MTPFHCDQHRSLIVIAHRGASGYRPEHTLEAYRLAIRQGADFIEPDLVATKDGVLIARHENDISRTSDVASHPEFADRHTTKPIDGRMVAGWFTEDFTLAEIKTLRAKERIPEMRPANARFDGMYQIPTFAEVVRLAKAESRAGRAIGVYPETKLPTYFADEGRRIDGTPIGVSLGRALVETLVAEGFTDPRRVYIQSFEVANLLELKDSIMPAHGVDFPLVQLFGDLSSAAPYDIGWNARRGADLAAIYGGLVAAAGNPIAGVGYGSLATGPVLRWMKTRYASGIGPRKADVLPKPQTSFHGDSEGDDGAGIAMHHAGHAHPMLAHALEAGLVVHPYTLRAEEPHPVRISTGVESSVVAEAVQLYRLGVQGFFIDQPDLGVAAREIFLKDCQS